MNTLFAIVSIILSIIVPVVYIIYSKKKFNFSLVPSSIAVGVVLYFICRPLVTSIYNVRLPEIYNHQIGMVVIAATSALIFTLFYFILAKFVYGDNFDTDDLVSYSLGLGITEIILSCLLTSISNVMYAAMISSGSLETYLSGTYDASSIQVIIDHYNSLPLTFYLYAGVCSLLIMTHAHCVACFWYKMRENWMKFVGSMFIIEWIYLSLYLVLPNISYTVFILVALVLSAGQFVLSQKFIQ